MTPTIDGFVVYVTAVDTSDDIRAHRIHDSDDLPSDIQLDNIINKWKRKINSLDLGNSRSKFNLKYNRKIITRQISWRHPFNSSWHAY